MLRGPAARTYAPTKPVMKLIRQLTARRELGQVTVEKPGFRLTLRRYRSAEQVNGQ